MALLNHVTFLALLLVISLNRMLALKYKLYLFRLAKTALIIVKNVMTRIHVINACRPMNFIRRLAIDYAKIIILIMITP